MNPQRLGGGRELSQLLTKAPSPPNTFGRAAGKMGSNLQDFIWVGDETSNSVRAAWRGSFLLHRGGKLRGKPKAAVAPVGISLDSPRVCCILLPLIDIDRGPEEYFFFFLGSLFYSSLVPTKP